MDCVADSKFWLTCMLTTAVSVMPVIFYDQYMREHGSASLGLDAVFPSFYSLPRAFERIQNVERKLMTQAEGTPNCQQLTGLTSHSNETDEID